MTILRFHNVYGRIDPPVEVTILGPCDGEQDHYRFAMPDGRIGCAKDTEMTDD